MDSAQTNDPRDDADRPQGRVWDVEPVEGVVGGPPEAGPTSPAAEPQGWLRPAAFAVAGLLVGAVLVTGASALAGDDGGSTTNPAGVNGDLPAGDRGGDGDLDGDGRHGPGDGPHGPPLEGAPPGSGGQLRADPDGLAPDGLAPDGLAPDGLAPDGLAPDDTSGGTGSTGSV